MTKTPEKLLEKARHKKAGWSTDELIALYEGFGFEVRMSKGSHRHISHPQFPKLRATVPDKRELPKAYVATCVKNIDELIGLLNKEEETEDDDNE